jgi:hypothetical protein
MPVDPETVIILPAYRVGFAPPVPDSLAAGEFYIEMGDGSASPKLWAGSFDNTVVPIGGDGGASQDDLDALQTQVDAMATTITDLETRVAALEAAAGGVTAETSTEHHRGGHHRNRT